MSTKRLTRREFLRVASLSSVGLVAAACAPIVVPATEPTKAPIAQSSPAPKATQGPRVGGLLRIAGSSDPVSIGYPPLMTIVTSIQAAAPAVETLFRTDSGGKPVPWLATGEKSDPAAKTLTLTLRQGVEFHDGTDFNAEAVKWNLEQSMAAKSVGTAQMKSVDVVDDSTVRINLAEWDNTVTSNLALSLGLMISPPAFKKNGKDWAASNPVGTGPFRFVSWQKGVKTVYKKFDGYWQKGKPYLDGIEWQVMPDPLTRELALKKKEVEVATSLTKQDLAGLEKEGFTVARQRTGSGAWGAVFDSANPSSPFSKLKVRQAAQHAVDTEAIVKSILNGEADAANQWVGKGHWAYNPNVVGYPYNSAKAKQLLAEAGYPNGFKTKINYRTNALDDLTFTAVQGYFKVVGIDAELVPMQNAAYDQIALQGGKWEGLMENAVSPNPDVAAAVRDRYSGGPYFTQMLLPDDYVAAVKAAITAPDFDAKQKAGQELMRSMVDNCLQLVLYYYQDTAASAPIAHNHGLFSVPNTAMWTPEEAWLATS
ncbi:MAG: ABC transporter substrate-binding protein [Chloroflexi bacterium]|nr:ABC transporter substrate-binding protein [Chloroflexota bacterium]